MAVNEDDYIGFRVDPDTGKRHKANHLKEAVTWEPHVYQFEDGDKLIGGPDGIDNLPLQELTNRTRYLYHWLRKAKDKLYIPMDSLIEYVTSGSAADDAVVIDVSADHKVTASLTDGKVTLAKLEADVQTKIGYIGDKAVSTQISDALAAAQETVTDEEIAGIFAD